MSKKTISIYYDGYYGNGTQLKNICEQIAILNNYRELTDRWAKLSEQTIAIDFETTWLNIVKYTYKYRYCSVV